MKKIAFVSVLVVSALAFAEDVKLTCPAGTKQVGGQKSAFEASLCMKFSNDGQRIFHGPYLSFWSNGQKQSVGQYEEGWRSGHWVYFDQNGIKTAEIDFVHGDYSGRRVQYYPNGQIKMDETYDHGKQLTMKTFDQNGAAISPQQLGVRATK